MQKILSNNLESIRALCAIYNVRYLYAFGSVCTNKFNENSDIDLLVSLGTLDFGDYADTYFLLADKFEEILKRPVDLITDKSLSNPYFIDTLNKSKVLLYGS
jgi:predicted nucleotidyltransferase